MDIYSDNGLNFVGAKCKLDELYEMFNNDIIKWKIVEFMTAEKIRWHFILVPAYGLWKAVIKNIKFHLKRIISEASLRYNKSYTTTDRSCIKFKVACSYISDDLQDLNAPTPVHFLIECPISNLYLLIDYCDGNASNN